MTIRALTHIGICVSDLERSRVFYRDGLGFTEVSSFATAEATTAKLLDIDAVDLHCVFIQRDGVRLELMQFRHPGHRGDALAQPMNQLGLTHLAFRVDNIDEFIAKLESLGATIFRQTRAPNAIAGTDVIFLSDPDGVRIELVSMPGDPKAPLGELIA